MIARGHFYSAAAGLLAGVAVGQHVILVAAVCFALGVVAGRVWAGIVRLAGAAVSKLTPAPAELEPAPYDREQEEEYCECGAHAKSTPCYFRATFDNYRSTHPSFDPWSRRVEP